MKVSYLGPKGSFSEIALSTYFGNNITAIPMPSIGDVFQAVVKNESTYGIIPIENSIEGSVNNSHDLLIESNVLISGEIELAINQCLLSKNSSKEDRTNLRSSAATSTSRSLDIFSIQESNKERAILNNERCRSLMMKVFLELTLFFCMESKIIFFKF